MTENHPVAAIVVPGSGKVPIAGNGTLMPGDTASGSVPEMPRPAASRRPAAAARRRPA